jgi:hypothetical protein
MLHKSSQQRYQKLCAQLRRLMNYFDLEALHEYIQTLNSLRDWIRRDHTLNQHQKDELERFVDARSVNWQTCNQIANYQKYSARIRVSRLLP